MKFVKMQCSACGAAIETKNGLKEVVCSYCGTKFVVDPKQFTPEEFQEYFDPTDEELLKTIKQDIEVLKQLEELEPREARTRYQLDKLKKEQKNLQEQKDGSMAIPIVFGVIALLLLLSTGMFWPLLAGLAAGGALYCFYPKILTRIKKEEWSKWRNFSPLAGVLLVLLFTVGPFAVLGLVILLAIVVLIVNRSQKAKAKKRLELEAQLQETEKLYDDCVRELGAARVKQDLSYVSEEYRNVEALDYIHTVLKNGKCKTVSKAVELYEDHKFKEQMMENQRQQAETIRLQREEIERMKREQTAQNTAQTSAKKSKTKTKTNTKTTAKDIEDMVDDIAGDSDDDLKKVLAGAAVVGAVAYKNRKKIAKVGKAVVKGLTKL